MPRIASQENLFEAFLRAAKGKSGKCAVIDFRRHLTDNLYEMQRQLLDGSFRFGHYHFFTVYDPKQRTICAASFPERVAFHAMMRICHPVFDHFQTSDSFASRKGLGQYAALERTQTLCHRFRWYAKLDVRKYFDTIHHEVLLCQLSRLFKDKQLMLYFRDLLDGYEVTPSRGLPIGNLTSQYFANHYLSAADHYAREQIGVKAMVRYMDDVLLFSNDRDELKSYVAHYSSYLSDVLRLELHEPQMNQVEWGIPYLGYVVRPSGMRLNQRSRNRFRLKMAMMNSDLHEGSISQQKYAERAKCLLAFIEKADVSGLKKSLTGRLGMYPQGL